MKNATHEGEEAPAAAAPPPDELVVALVSDGIASINLFASSDDGDDHIVKAYTCCFRLTIRSQSGNTNTIGTRVIQCAARVSTSTGLVGRWRPIASTTASDNQVPRAFQLAPLASPSPPIAIAVSQAAAHQPEPESDPSPHRILPLTEGVYVFTGRATGDDRYVYETVLVLELLPGYTL